MFNNSRTTRKIVQSLALVALTTPSLTACGSSSNKTANDTITLAVAPAESSRSLQSDYDNLVKLIARGTSKEVKFQNVSDYAAVVKGQRAGKIDIASYGPFSYVVTHDSGVSIGAVAPPTNDGSKAPVRTSLAYVKEGSDIESLKDLKDKEACFVDPASTSDYLVLIEGLMDEGLKPGVDLEPVMAGGHDASLFTSNDGGCDVAFAHDTMLKTLEKPNQIKPGALKSIWESEPITEDPITLNTETISAENLIKVKTTLSNRADKPALVKEGICPSEEDCVLSEKVEWGHLPITDADFNSIREICETTGADACNAVS